jgi:predicted  nucleic acid-binding Zn-ribbon protein
MMETVMQKDIELLLKMQEIDYYIGELERSKDYIPDMIENLKKEIDDCFESSKNYSERLTEAKVEMKNLELEVNASKEALEKYQKQMLAIKTNKEYDALVKEIDECKENISSGEDKILMLMGEIEELTGKVEEYEGKCEEVKEENTTQLDTLQAQIDSVEEKRKIKEDERKNVQVRIPKQVMVVYERIRKGRGGMAVVAVKKRACGACFKQLEPQLIQEIKKGDRLITCDSCGRILVWTGEDE